MVLPRTKTTEEKGMPLLVQGFDDTSYNKVWWPIGALAALALSATLIEYVDAAVWLSIMACLFIVFMVTAIWVIYTINRTFPVALSDAGILVDRVGTKFDIPWSEVTRLVQKPYYLKYTIGINLMLEYTRDGKPQALQLGTMRAADAMFSRPMLMTNRLLKRRVHITPNYDEIIAYVASKGAKVEPLSDKEMTSTTFAPRVDLSNNVLLGRYNFIPKNDKELGEIFVKARAEGRVKIVRR